MADILFHPEAQDEYDDAMSWYRSRSPEAAERFEAEMGHTLSLIGDKPHMFPKYDDEHRFTVLQKFPYSIVYQVEPTHVSVIAVAHSSRQPGYWYGRG